MKTAVEFAFEELNKWRIENFGKDSLIGIPQEVLDRAKEIERQQHNKTFVEGLYCESGDSEEFEKYFNRTFKQ